MFKRILISIIIVFFASIVFAQDNDNLDQQDPKGEWVWVDDTMPAQVSPATQAHNKPIKFKFKTPKVSDFVDTSLDSSSSVDGYPVNGYLPPPKPEEPPGAADLERRLRQSMSKSRMK